jgi:6-phosphofructokinase
MPRENLMIVQGGGPTSVFNASLAATIAEALAQPRIGRIFGARFGMKGLATADSIELTHLTPADLHTLRHSPGAALASSRFKPTEQDLEQAVTHLRRLDIRHLIFLGGNGTMSGAARFSDFCRQCKLDLQVIGVPKTIDNDISETDRCPGFASAARFVAQSTLDLAMDIRSLPQPVSIFETLGRDVGWLAAASTLAKRDADDAPHLVYVPEIPFGQQTFLDSLDSIVSRVGWAVVVVSEGIGDAAGNPVFEQKTASPKNPLNRPLIGGVAQYLSGIVAENLGIRCRSEKPGLIGRSCIAQVSGQDRSDAELVGREGVRALLAGQTDCMVSLCSLDGHSETEFKLVALRHAGTRRALPVEWLSTGPIPFNDAFLRYLSPIVGDLSYYPSPLSERKEL